MSPKYTNPQGTLVEEPMHVMHVFILNLITLGMFMFLYLIYKKIWQHAIIYFCLSFFIIPMFIYPFYVASIFRKHFLEKGWLESNFNWDTVVRLWSPKIFNKFTTVFNLSWTIYWLYMVDISFIFWRIFTLPCIPIHLRNRSYSCSWNFVTHNSMEFLFHCAYYW